MDTVLGSDGSWTIIDSIASSCINMKTKKPTANAQLAFGI